jgi:hypothetical protein
MAVEVFHRMAVREVWVPGLTARGVGRVAESSTTATVF